MNEPKLSSAIVGREKSKPKVDASTVSIQASTENKHDFHRREKKRSRHHSRGKERLQSSKNIASSLNEVMRDVVMEPKTERAVHSDLFSDSDDDTPKYDVYSLARLFQGQVTENFRALNSQILDPVMNSEEADNTLYCLCRYLLKTYNIGSLITY